MWRPPQWLRRRDQPTVAAWLAIGACGMALAWVGRGGLTGQLVSIDRVPPIEYRVALEINRADWPELTLLPGISRTMALRIVRHRGESGPFRTADDLQRIPGIGPKTVAKLRPYLKVDASTADRPGPTEGAEIRSRVGRPR